MNTLNKNKIVASALESSDVTFDEIRARVFKGIGVATIQSMSAGELLRLQTLLGLGDQWGVLNFPKAWMPPGMLSQDSSRIVDIRTSLQSPAVSTPDRELAIRTIVAAVLLYFATPIFNPRYVQYLKPSSINGIARKLTKAAVEAVKLPARLDGKLLARLPKPDRRNGDKQKRMRIELERLARFAERGLWHDISEDVLGPPPMPLPAGAPVSPTPPPKDGKYLPLNDKFLAEAGHRLVWIVETLGPSLLRCGRDIHEIRMANPLSEGVRDTHGRRRTELSKAFLQDFAWVDPEGNPILELPFSMNFSGMGKGGKFSWPPRTMAQTRMLLRVLQSAHLFIFLISTGGRISEALSLEPGCITESPDGVPLANGRTYKLSLSVDGQQRDWPLPAIAVHALRQQDELAKLVILDYDSDEQKHASIESIWTREGGSGERIDGEYNKYLKNIVKIFGLSEEFGEGNLHAHRFRKTTARLIALAILGAPKILMDLFGHKQIGMTLHYILSDPVIRAEMLEVARAQTIMLAKSAIEDADKCGGPAAVKLRTAIKAERFRMGSDFDEETLQELAETLTLNGRHWQLVRPGVLCTKGPQISGACTPSTAMAEPSRCRTRCDHRLELSFLKDDVDKTIAIAVKELNKAIADNDYTKSEMWRGQILTNIDRFGELEAKWRSNPLIGDLLKKRSEAISQ